MEWGKDAYNENRAYPMLSKPNTNTYAKTSHREIVASLLPLRRNFEASLVGIE